jgi:lipopolysaccharide transport system ATP-binding protein
VLAVGDAQFQKKCLGKMEDVSEKEGRTIIFVSHNLAAICQLCNKGIHLQYGEIFNLGDIRCVMDSYNALTTNSFEYVFVNNNLKEKATILFATVKNDDLDKRKYMFVIEFDAKEQISDIQVGMGINDKFGTRLATLFSKFYDSKFIAIKGINRIYCEVEDLSLKTGLYNISIHLGNGFVSFDYVHDAFQMKIEADDFFPSNKSPDDSQGSLLISQTWKRDMSMEIING